MSFFRFLGARGKPSHPHSCLKFGANWKQEWRHKAPFRGWGVKRKNSRPFLAVKIFYFWLSKLANLDAKNDLNRNPETSEHFSEMRREKSFLRLFSFQSSFRNLTCKFFAYYFIRPAGASLPNLWKTPASRCGRPSDFVRFRRSKAAPRIAKKGIFRPSKPFLPSPRGISRPNAKKCLKSLYFALK